MEVVDYFEQYEINCFVTLILSYCLQEKITNLKYDEEENYMVYNLAIYHDLEYLIASSLEYNGIKLSDKLFKNKFIKATKCFTQDSEFEEIKKAFNEHKIAHLPLKGSVIRKYYDDPVMRDMSDIDILVHKNDMKQAKNIMIKELGYKLFASNDNSPHDAFTKEPYMDVEIHRKLMVDEAKVAPYLACTWDRCYQDNDYTYKLNDSDFYIYNIMHNVKHFCKAGTGVRILLDLYYMFKHMKLDFDYINQELKKFGLDTYSDCLVNLTNKLFNKEILLEDEIFLLDYLIYSGTHGSVFFGIVGDVVANNDKENMDKGRSKYFFNRLFPPYKVMKSRNPILKKLPFLLPWFWFTRLIKGLFHFKKNSEHVKRIKEVKERDYESRTRLASITKINPYDW